MSHSIARLLLITMNKVSKLGRYAFQDPCFFVVFFLFWWVLPHLNIFDNILGITVTNTNDIHEEIKRRINMGNACYYSLEKILSPYLLSKKLKVLIISLSKFSLPLIGTFTWLTLPGPYRATTCRGRELNYGSHTYFFDHTRTWGASPDEWSAQCRGHLRDSTNMKNDTHQAHTQSSQQGEYGMKITTAKWYSGTSGA